MLNDTQKSICWWERESLKNDKKRTYKNCTMLELLTSNIISYKILNHKSFSFPIFKTFLAKLVPVWFSIWSPKSIFSKKPAQKQCLVNIKRNFLVKVAFYICEGMRVWVYGGISVHFVKSWCAFKVSVRGWVCNYVIALQ